MITRENFNEVINSIKYDEIENILFDNPEYISIELMIANAGSWVFLNGYSSYDDEVVNEIQANGNVFCDKDDFLRLLEEANHPYTKESIEEQIETTKEKVRRVMIQHIKNYVRLTHNEQDIKTLEGMTYEELSDIMEEIKECSK